jgi:hypothetical protein
MILKIPRWEDFQHYGKMRRPPWLKLHRSLLENRRWHNLSPNSAKLLVELWLVFASEEEDGVLTGDVVDDLCWRLHRTQEDTLPALQELTAAGFVEIEHHASSVLAPCEHDASSDARSDAPLEPRSIEESRGDKRRVRAARENYSGAFEKVWEIHGRGSKEKAGIEYLAAVANGVTHDVIVEKLTGYVAAELRPDDNPPFKGQHLFRWLKEGRWEEDFEVKKDERYRPAPAFEWFPPILKELEEGK